ncbi:sugar nucleotide-binding protein [Paenibacillus sp. L3-i20]|uniref:SDR family oxidoreductase n=1 Tax=Paenibacillus sp. L3-i20 TaxID=2905833 RepID=UPI001EDFF942|nr:sugar nucleotide-binding protein [Paenibacillus sp. L3-i20]GKU77384.1 NAD(P)-dependent oxidoreductase [Paenibacillus sp. L3-i20]
MKFLILGASGMAGHTISIYLQEKGHEVTTFSRSPFPFGENINGTISENYSLHSLLQTKGYDVIINCIGVLNQACDLEPARAVYLNSYLPHAIADLLKGTATKLIHMSTDCVFSGKSAPYYEHSHYDGDTFYDRTKALGEIDHTHHLTFRNSIIGPDMKKDGIGLFNWFMKQKGNINGYTGAIWTGVTTLTLAKAMEKAATERITGIYNLVNNKSITKFDLLKLFNKTFKADELTITPSDTVNADKTLVNTRTDLSFEVPSYEVMVAEMKQWVDTHKSLYPHYFD